MNRNIRPGWFWIVIGTWLNIYFFNSGVTNEWRTIMRPWDSILIIGGGMLLTVCGIIQVRRPTK